MIKKVQHLAVCFTEWDLNALNGRWSRECDHVISFLVLYKNWRYLPLSTCRYKGEVCVLASWPKKGEKFGNMRRQDIWPSWLFQGGIYRNQKNWKSNGFWTISLIHLICGKSKLSGKSCKLYPNSLISKMSAFEWRRSYVASANI